MLIKKYLKFDKRRRYVMAKINQKVSIEDLVIEEIKNSSTNDWDELCNECSSLIDEAKMTDEDIDDVIKKVKSGIL